MSPRKLTEDDKQEILQLYRTSEATTSTLATRYEVSSSTISRFLKNKLSPSEYEDLIQQKRLARTPRGETLAHNATQTGTTKTENKSKSKSKSAKSQPQVEPAKTETVVEVNDGDFTATTIVEPTTESKSFPTRRRRRRHSSAAVEPVEAKVTTTDATETVLEESLEGAETSKLLIDRKPTGTSKVSASDRGLILKADRVALEEEEEEDDEVDIITLKEMLGEDLQDINEDEDDEDEDDEWEDDNEESITYSCKSAGFSDIQILPLSQAALPRTCYLVIDRSAELIVKPLADFADLGAIPQEEVKQQTLPVFDNHRIAKRFSHRRERVIKVPDSRMLQKTSRHLQDKGITRLLIDGQIYSLSS